MSDTQIEKRRYPVGVNHHNFKHGGRSIYKDVVRQQLADKMQALDDHDPYSIADEALLLRALLMEVLEREKGTLSDVQSITQVVEQITRTVERMTRMRNDTAITAAEVKLVGARIADVVSRYIPDAETQARFLADIFAIGIPTSSE